MELATRDQHVWRIRVLQTLFRSAIVLETWESPGRHVHRLRLSWHAADHRPPARSLVWSVESLVEWRHCENQAEATRTDWRPGLVTNGADVGTSRGSAVGRHGMTRNKGEIQNDVDVNSATKAKSERREWNYTRH
nr:hypothetical protein CFP56_36193 [Quercus suber]